MWTRNASEISQTSFSAPSLKPPLNSRAKADFGSWDKPPSRLTSERQMDVKVLALTYRGFALARGKKEIFE
jgi:hypothetical protein